MLPTAREDRHRFLVCVARIVRLHLVPSLLGPSRSTLLGKFDSFSFLEPFGLPLGELDFFLRLLRLFLFVLSRSLSPGCDDVTRVAATFLINQLLCFCLCLGFGYPLLAAHFKKL